MRPWLARSATVPQHCDGQRSEPPISLPAPSGDIPVASETASPPLDPPGVRAASHGFKVGPIKSLSVCQRSENSGKLVREIGIAV